VGSIPSVVVGVSTGFHDAAAAVVVDGRVAAAVEQERLTRHKHDASFPAEAVVVALASAGVDPADVDVVAVHEKPVLVLSRYVATKVRVGPGGLLGLAKTFPPLAREHLLIGRNLDRLFARLGVCPPPVAWVEHHASHAAAAFHPSPFDSAAVLTVDGVGEWATATIAHGAGHRVTMHREMRFPDSVGLLYSAVTGYCGLRVNSGEGELMGLAPFGVPRFAEQLLDEVVTVHDDGSIRLAPRYFAYLRGNVMTSRRFHRRFGGPPLARGAEVTQREADLAASVQQVLELVLTRMASHAHRVTGERRLCLAGGVALNCVANSVVARSADVDDIWIQPAAGDGGGAVGAALHHWHETLGNPRHIDADSMSGMFLGPSFAPEEIERFLDESGVGHERVADAEERCDRVAQMIDDGAVVGVFGGRMEYGPRALGHRSIVADPRDPGMQARINDLIKDRQAFRPFAPAVLDERAGEWFDLDRESPFMILTADVLEARRLSVGDEPEGLAERAAVARSTIPACTHVDGSARVQTVRADTNPRFHRLLSAFERRTGCPVLLNTSFNGHDEPIVCTPDQALATAARCGLDALVLEDCIVSREQLEACR
jgi:carbamoyltransferase